VAKCIVGKMPNQVSEWFLNGTSAHIKLFSALQWYGKFNKQVK